MRTKQDWEIKLFASSQLNPNTLAPATCNSLAVSREEGEKVSSEGSRVFWSSMYSLQLLLTLKQGELPKLSLLWYSRKETMFSHLLRLISVSSHQLHSLFFFIRQQVKEFFKPTASLLFMSAQCIFHGTEFHPILVHFIYRWFCPNFFLLTNSRSF